MEISMKASFWQLRARLPSKTWRLPWNLNIPTRAKWSLNRHFLRGQSENDPSAAGTIRNRRSQNLSHRSSELKTAFRARFPSKTKKLNMWKQSFRARFPYKTGNSTCENTSFMRIFCQLDDGWPESVEEQSLLLLVRRHFFTRQYFKDVI